MLLPEYRTRVLMSDEVKKPKPFMDEEVLGLIEERINTASITGQTVNLSIWEPPGTKKVTGQVIGIMAGSREIKLQTLGKKVNIPLDSILMVDLVY